MLMNMSSSRTCSSISSWSNACTILKDLPRHHQLNPFRVFCNMIDVLDAFPINTFEYLQNVAHRRQGTRMTPTPFGSVRQLLLVGWEVKGL
jgi:hypothetical protein